MRFLSQETMGFGRGEGGGGEPFPKICQLKNLKQKRKMKGGEGGRERDNSNHMKNKLRLKKKRRGGKIPDSSHFTLPLYNLFLSCPLPSPLVSHSPVPPSSVSATLFPTPRSNLRLTTSSPRTRYTLLREYMMDTQHTLSLLE